MGLVLHRAAHLRKCVCIEDHSASDGRNPTIDAGGGTGDDDGCGLV
jgi:hypothetical protein